jgi:aminomethyltransferase
MVNVSDDMCLFAVQGPLAAKALQPLTMADLDSMEYYTFEKTDFAGYANVIVSATGYTGAGGFEIYVSNHQAEGVWDAIIKAGNPTVLNPLASAHGIRYAWKWVTISTATTSPTKRLPLKRAWAG